MKKRVDDRKLIITSMTVNGINDQMCVNNLPKET